MTDLATTLGVTARSITAWRKQGAPAGDNELAWRIWHLLELSNVPKAKQLNEPSPDLAEIINQVRQRLQAHASDDPGRQVKERQVLKLDQQIARGEHEMQLAAQKTFRDLLGKLSQDWERSLPGLLDRCHEATATKAGRIPVLRSLRKHISNTFNAAITKALRKLSK